MSIFSTNIVKSPDSSVYYLQKNPHLSYTGYTSIRNDEGKTSFKKSVFTGEITNVPKNGGSFTSLFGSHEWSRRIGFQRNERSIGSFVSH